MKRTFTTLTLASLALIGASSFIRSNQTGIAGYTASPGEATCNSCHGGAQNGGIITLSSVPAFTNDEFVPGTTYVITVNVASTNPNLTRFGFGCEILDDFAANAGTMQNPGAGVKFLNAGARKNAVHSTPKTASGSANFTFEWVAPSQGDTATIYVAGNAVNNNASTSGDGPLAPIKVQLKAAQPVNPVGIDKNTASPLAYLSVYPNPAGSLSQISYQLLQSQQVSVELIDIYGKTVKTCLHEKQEAGLHSHLLDLHGLASGVYFVKLSGNNTKLAQKLIAVQ